MACITAYYNDRKAGTWDIDEQPLVLGRNPEADIFLKEKGLSRNHCQFRKKQGRVIVTDTDSINGTYVNGTRIVQATLVNGDRIAVGRYRLMFADSSTEDSPLPDTGRRLYRAVEQQKKEPFGRNPLTFRVRSADTETTHEVYRTDILIGSGPWCDIVVDDPKISPVCLLVVRYGSGMKVIDVSEGGTMRVHGESTGFRSFHAKGCTVRAGDTEIIVDAETR